MGMKISTCAENGTEACYFCEILRYTACVVHTYYFIAGRQEKEGQKYIDPELLHLYQSNIKPRQ